MNKKKTEELTWAEVKAMFAENERRWAKSRVEFDRRMAESRAEFVKGMAKSRAEFVKGMAESRAEFVKGMAESRAEFDRRLAEADKRQVEADKRQAELDKRIDKMCAKVGGIDDNIGHHAEQFFQDTFAETMTFGGEKYDKIIKNFQFTDKTIEAEFDIVLINGKSVAIIEVKNRIHPNFVKVMATEKVAKFRRFFPQFKKHKAYLGIAGFSFSKAVRDEAQKLGVGIVKQVGNSVEIDAEHLKAY